MQADFIRWLRLNAVKYPILNLFYAVPNGGFRHVSTAIRLKKTGTIPGIPDMHFPVARYNFHSLYLEFKTEKGVLSQSQKEMFELLREQPENAYPEYLESCQFFSI